ncbi:hypothetical protein Cgig2_033691 [Carnegiea gigantea]|uniref:Transposase, Ptta/En/Spm, plant n=1 Tax=Carnegiea gigantea TaxID=171969 RepID=A0A9Q1K7U1_9CARY|nr:hypothetical protein Cgig2_033691 [Carnegiea gigantea]
MSFRSKRTRAEARTNETTWGSTAEHTIVEENVQTNPVHGRNTAQFTAASNIPLSSLPNSSNETQRQSRCLEDDDDLRNGETHSQHSQIPDWNNTIEFNEQEKVQIRDKDGNSKLRGGTILPSHVWSLLLGDRIVVPFNDFYQPLRKEGHQKFVLPPNEIVNKKLLRRYKVPRKTKQDVKDKVLDHVIRDKWIKLQLSNQGKEAHASQDHCHTTRNKSFAMKRDELEKETGRKPGPLEFYIASHKRKDGSFKKDSALKDFVDTAEALIAERMTDGASAKDVEDEVFHELMYRSQSDQDKKYQRIVGHGMGVTYNQVFGVDGEIRKRGYVSCDNSNEEAVMLRAEVVGLKSYLTAQAEEMKQMKGMHQQMQNEMHDQFLHLTSLLVNKFGGPNVTITSTPSGSEDRENDIGNNIQVIHLNCLSYCCV